MVSSWPFAADSGNATVDDWEDFIVKVTLQPTLQICILTQVKCQLFVGSESRVCH